MKNLIDLLVKHEGLRTKPYEDTVGVLTIGVGRNLDDVGLSHDEIYYMLKNDIRRCEEELDNAFRWYKDLDQVRKGCYDKLVLQSWHIKVEEVQTGFTSYGSTGLRGRSG
jgi:lysozyme